MKIRKCNKCGIELKAFEYAYMCDPDEIRICPRCARRKRLAEIKKIVGKHKQMRRKKFNY